jgi:hypothetical protein
MPVITSPSQLFRYNDREYPTHTCFVFEIKGLAHFGPPTFDSAFSNALFQVRSHDNGVSICELYLPKKNEGLGIYSDPQFLAVAVTTELVGWAAHAYTVRLTGAEDYSRYHSDNTDPQECYC